MNMEGKAKAAREWAKTWEQLDGYLKLNAINAQDEDAAIYTVPKDSKGEPYIDGTAEHEFTFGLKMMLPWSDGHDDINAKANELVEQWRDWVDEQYPENVPDWGCEIEDIRALYDEPAVMVYPEDSLAEYQFLARITYTE